MTDQLLPSVAYEEALDASDVGAFEIDLVARSVRGSRHFRALLHLAPEGPISFDDLAALLPEEERSRVWAEVSEGGERFRVERCLHLSNGAQAWREARGRAHRSTAGGPIVRLTGVVLSSEERRRLEQQRDELLRTLSHDLRTPLSTIQLQVQLLERTAPLGEAGARRAKTILSASQRMNAMIQDLVDASRLESGPVALERRPVHLEPFLRDLLERHASSLEIDRVALDVPATLPAVNADPRRLDRMVAHLLSNALRFSPPDSPVSVSAESSGRQVLLRIADQGPGIPPEEQPRLFERFFRGASARSSPGLGLGLYIVALLAKAHEGTVQARTSPGAGSVFELSLPSAP